jgi:hypothetical protein
MARRRLASLAALFALPLTSLAALVILPLTVLAIVIGLAMGLAAGPLILVRETQKRLRERGSHPFAAPLRAVTGVSAVVLRLVGAVAPP